jgi:integrase
LEPGFVTEAKREKAEANHKVLTEENVLTLQLKRRQYVVWDRGNGRGSEPCQVGLSVLVSPGATRTYRSTFYFPPDHPKGSNRKGGRVGHTRKLGRVGELTLKQAREQCARDRVDAKNGIDPRERATSSDRYLDAVMDYIAREQIGKRGNISHAEVKRILESCTAWHQRPVATITPQEIHEALEKVRDGSNVDGTIQRPRPYLANALHTRLRTFFDWCAKPTIGKLATSPMVGIDKPWNGAKPRDREWFKSTAGDQAIRSLWSAADKLDAIEGAYLKMLLLTAKRKSALAKMRWERIDADWFWDAPPSERKNKRLHGIPLPSLAQRVLHPRKSTGFVFPGDHDGHLRVNGDMLQKRIIKASGFEDFFFHGVRHLAETKMAELRIAAHIRDVLFDHAPVRGTGKSYDHHDYRDDMLAALETWAGHIERLVSPAGVTMLR